MGSSRPAQPTTPHCVTQANILKKLHQIDRFFPWQKASFNDITFIKWKRHFCPGVFSQRGIATRGPQASVSDASFFV